MEDLCKTFLILGARALKSRWEQDGRGHQKLARIDLRRVRMPCLSLILEATAPEEPLAANWDEAS